MLSSLKNILLIPEGVQPTQAWLSNSRMAPHVSGSGGICGFDQEMLSIRISNKSKSFRIHHQIKVSEPLTRSLTNERNEENLEVSKKEKGKLENETRTSTSFTAILGVNFKKSQRIMPFQCFNSIKQIWLWKCINWWHKCLSGQSMMKMNWYVEQSWENKANITCQLRRLK